MSKKILYCYRENSERKIIMDNKKAISTNNFKIEDHTISFNDSLVQISNIAHIDVKPLPKPIFQIWSVFAVVIGIFLIIGFTEEIQILGFLLVGLAVIYVIYYILNCIDNEERYLCIYLNSGHIYYIYCENKILYR